MDCRDDANIPYKATVQAIQRMANAAATPTADDYLDTYIFIQRQSILFRIERKNITVEFDRDTL